MKSYKKGKPVSVLLERKSNKNDRLQEEKQLSKETQTKTTAMSKEGKSSFHKTFIDKLQNMDDLDYKKKIYELSENENSDTEENSQAPSESSVHNLNNVKRAERALKDLEISFQCAKEEEERLKRKLKKLKREEKKGKEFKKPTVKLENKNKELRKENEVLHVALKEENQFMTRQRIASLEQSLHSRENELLECKTQLEALYILQEENKALNNLLENLRETEKRNEREWKEKEENSEKGWIKKISDMRTLYERAVQGYKEQLLISRDSYESLEKKFREVIDYYEKNEKDLMIRHEKEVKDLNAKVISAKNEKETLVFLRLEDLLKQKDEEIETLKIELQCFKENVNIDPRIQENIVKELKEENKRLKEDLQNRTLEVRELKEGLRRVEKNVEKLAPQKHEVYNEKREIDAETLKEFPKLLKEKEEKLKNAQTLSHKSEIEVKLYEERLRNCSVEIELKKARISELEDRVKELASHVRKLERDNEKLEGKIEVLETHIEKKNKILEKNSIQIEERIREYRSLASQMERLREDHYKEIASLKDQLETSRVDPKLLETHLAKEKLESELGNLRSEKNHMEKGLRKRISILEEEMNILKIKNNTLQNHLHSVQEKYKTMFSLDTTNLTTFNMLHNQPNLLLERNGASK
ncbi:hypothetical protein Anas_09699 [Armadillidium nasatum]|uniref:Uncharacterized protein n=1 Tax=Armadillidium nasatum TaxID=96803 RepID=A0A5N5TAV5_9CRUS|nr:hypothetical protein Anas_09699 [Armadillidium nasatum]